MEDNYYNEISNGYEELYLEEQLKKVMLIKKYFHPSKEDKLLDVGCGSGITTVPWNCERYGIDTSKELIKKAILKETEKYNEIKDKKIKEKIKENKIKEKIEENKIIKDNKIKYLIARAENIPFPNKTFDHVISITAIQNFDNVSKGLDEIKRVGKNSFVLTFLKKSAKREMIEKLIREKFNVKKILEEEKDIIYFCE